MIATEPRVCVAHANILHQVEPQVEFPENVFYTPRHIQMTVIGFQAQEISEQFYERAKKYGCDICYGRTTENDILREQGFM